MFPGRSHNYHVPSESGWRLCRLLWSEPQPRTGHIVDFDEYTEVEQAQSKGMVFLKRHSLQWALS